MATKTWSATGGEKPWSGSNNWTPTGVPQAGDDVVIDGTGSSPCLLDVASNALNSFTMSTGAFNFSTNTLTVTGNVSITGGTVTKGTGTLDITQSGNLTNATSSNELYILKCAASGYTTTLTGECHAERWEVGAGTLALTSYAAQVGNGNTGGGVKILTINASATITRTTTGGEFYLYQNNTTGTNTFDGFSATVQFSVFGGAGASAGTLQLVTRALNCGAAGIWLWNNGTIDWNDFNVTCVSFQINACTLLTGTGTFDINGPADTFDNSATWNMEGATIQVTGDFNVGTCTIVPGTATLQFNGSGTQLFNPQGETYPDIDMLGSGELDLQAALTCADLDVQSGTFDTNSYAVTCVNWTLTAGTFVAGTSTITVSGNCERIGGTLTGTSGTWDLAGSGNLRNDFLTTPFGLVKCAAATKTTTLIDTCVAKKWEFGTGVLTANGAHDFSVYQPTAGKLITNAGVTINASGGTNPNYRQWYGAGGAGFTYDAVDFGSGNVTIDPGTNTYVDLLGNWTTTGTFTYSAASNGSNFDLNGYNLTCGALVLSGSGSNTQVLYCGEGIVDCTSFATGTLAGVTTLNLETCTFKCSGDFTIGHVNHVITYGTSEVQLDGTGAQAINLNGEQLYDLTVTNTGGTVSFTTAMSVAGTFKPGNGASTVTMRFPTAGVNYWNAVDTSGASGTGTLDMNSISGIAPWNLTIGSNQTVTSVDVAYSNLTGFTIDATDSTNVDGGNNSANWVFTAAGQNVPEKMNSYRRRRS